MKEIGSKLGSNFLPDKIHYQQFDSLGRVLQVLVNNDAKAETGKSLTGNDGEQVNGIDQVLAYKHNVKGERIEMQRDNNVDGVYDYREVYTLDANGNQEAKSIDLTNDGKIDDIVKNTLDAKGNVIAAESYNQEANGSQYLAGRETFTRDANGNVTSKSIYSAFDELKSIQHYQNDAQGRVSKSLVDDLGDGSIEYSTIYTRDANGNIVKSELDMGNTGQINSVTEYVRNALGWVTTQSYDAEADGKIDQVRTYKYDVYGNNIESTLDGNNDGSVNSIEKREYNAQNQLISRYVDSKADGLTADDTTYLYTYNEYGLVSSTETTNALTGVSDRVRHFTYDEYGRELSVLLDQGSDGVMDSRIDMTYSDRNHGKISETSTNLVTGEIDYIATYDYNAAGRIIRTYYDNGGEGTVDRLDYGFVSTTSGVNLVDDITSWSSSALDKIKGLTMIRLSSSSFSTEITLDSATIAAISPANNLLSIRGDSTDTVNLEGFTKLESSSVRGYNEYTTTVGSETYNVLVTDTVETVLG